MVEWYQSGVWVTAPRRWWVINACAFYNRMIVILHMLYGGEHRFLAKC